MKSLSSDKQQNRHRQEAEMKEYTAKRLFAQKGQNPACASRAFLNSAGSTKWWEKKDDVSRATSLFWHLRAPYPLCPRRAFDVPSSVSGTTLYHPDFTVFPSTSSVWADFVVSSLVWFLSYRPLLLSFINPNLVTGPGAAFCTGFSGKSTQKQFPSPV